MIDSIDIVLKKLDKFPNPNTYTDWSTYSLDVQNFLSAMGEYSTNEILLKDELNVRFGQLNSAITDINTATSTTLTNTQTVNQKASEVAEDTDFVAAKREEIQELLDNFEVATKEQLNLDKVDNTADIDKPISKAVQEALDLKVNKIDLSNIFPKNIALPFWGSVADIPTGWQLCDGTNGTPDLRDRFIISAGNSYNVGATGGSKDSIIVEHTHTQEPHTHAQAAHTHTQTAHTHTGTIGSNGAHTHTAQGIINAAKFMGTTISDKSNGTVTTSSAGAHTHTAAIGATTAVNASVTPTINNATPTITTTGVSGLNANMPPYYALAFIAQVNIQELKK